MNELPTSQPTQQIHLVVVELHHHSELIRNLYDVLCNGLFRISLITIPEVYQKTGLESYAQPDDLSVYLLNQEESVSDFLQRVRPVFEGADIVYFNTIRHFWKELNQIPLTAPSMLRIHNAHCDLAPATHFRRPIVNSVVILSHLIRKVWIGGEWRARERMLSRVGYFMFPNETITDYVLSNGWVPESKVLAPTLPFSYLGDPTPRNTENDPVVTIGITGKVIDSKKDYSLVQQALALSMQRLQRPIALVLLGNANRKHAGPIIDGFRALECEHFTVDYTESHLPAEDFDQKMGRVDFLIAPIRTQTHFRKYVEVYGKSKMSGIENDILRHRKPSLVTSDYALGGSLNLVAEYFEPTPESLAAHICDWVNERRFEKLEKKFEGLDAYKPDVIATRFHQVCQRLLNDSEKASQMGREIGSAGN